MLTTGHVIGALDYGGCGVETNALALVRGLRSKGMRSVVYCTELEPSAREREFTGAADGFEHSPMSGTRASHVMRLRDGLKGHAVDCVVSYAFANHFWVSLAAHMAGVRRCHVRVAGSPLKDRSTRLKSLMLAQMARPFCDGEIAIPGTVHCELEREFAAALAPGRDNSQRHRC